MSTTDQAAATWVTVGAAISTTANTRWSAAIGGGGIADRAVADKANETKPKNADDVSN